VVPSNNRWTVARAVRAVALANLAYFGVEFAVARERRLRAAFSLHTNTFADPQDAETRSSVSSLTRCQRRQVSSLKVPQAALGGRRRPSAACPTEVRGAEASANNATSGPPLPRLKSLNLQKLAAAEVALLRPFPAAYKPLRLLRNPNPTAAHDTERKDVVVYGAIEAR
jgi:hypothetical protein